jgi:predicted HTH transcriptional regulator
LGKAERAGTGIPRMLYETARLGAPPPEFAVTENSFTVKFWSRHRDLPRLLAESREEYRVAG